MTAFAYRPASYGASPLDLEAIEPYLMKKAEADAATPNAEITSPMCQ